MIRTKLGNFQRIVIYQYGKVGSASLGANLCQWLKIGFPGTTLKIQVKYPKVIHIHSPEIMEDILEKYDSILVVNACRNFYDRQISEFFQQSKNASAIRELEKHSDEGLVKLGEMLRKNDIFRLNDWYNANFEQVLGIKLNDFDYDKHYALGRGGRKRCQVVALVVRLEDSRQWEKIFRRLVHDKIRLGSKKNISQNRWYGDIYKELKKTFRYSPEETLQLAQSDTHLRFYQDLDKLGLDLPINFKNDT